MVGKTGQLGLTGLSTSRTKVKLWGKCLLIILVFVWACLKGRSWWQYLFQYRGGTSEWVGTIQSYMTSQHTNIICINKELTVVSRPRLMNWRNVNFKQANESQGKGRRRPKRLQTKWLQRKWTGMPDLWNRTVVVSWIGKQLIKENAYGSQDPRHVLSPKMMMMLMIISVCSKLLYH